MRYSELHELRNPSEIKDFRTSYDDPTLVNATMQSPYNDPEWKETLVGHMRKYGFELLGTGINGAVFGKTDYPYVLKVFRNDEGYEHWLGFCQANQNNKFVPKIKGKPIRLNNVFKAVRVEMLESCKDVIGKFNSITSEFFDMYYKEQERIRMDKDYIYNKDVYDIAMFMKKFEGHTDLTVHNLMYRRAERQLVIIDPIYIIPTSLKW